MVFFSHDSDADYVISVVVEGVGVLLGLIVLHACGTILKQSILEMAAKFVIASKTSGVETAAQTCQSTGEPGKQHRKTHTDTAVISNSCNCNKKSSLVKPCVISGQRSLY